MDKIIDFLPLILLAGVVALVLTLGRTFNAWLRMRHGYPLDNGWGTSVHPLASEGTGERVKLLTQENAQLRAELGAIKDRLGNVERIVTDRGTLLAQEIDHLRDRAN